jgi:hypothetical protein
LRRTTESPRSGAWKPRTRANSPASRRPASGSPERHHHLPNPRRQSRRMHLANGRSRTLESAGRHPLPRLKFSAAARRRYSSWRARRGRPVTSGRARGFLGQSSRRPPSLDVALELSRLDRETGRLAAIEHALDCCRSPRPALPGRDRDRTQPTTLVSVGRPTAERLRIGKMMSNRGTRVSTVESRDGATDLMATRRSVEGGDAVARDP